MWLRVLRGMDQGSGFHYGRDRNVSATEASKRREQDPGRRKPHHAGAAMGVGRGFEQRTPGGNHPEVGLRTGWAPGFVAQKAAARRAYSSRIVRRWHSVPPE